MASLAAAATAVLVACTGGVRLELAHTRLSMRSPWPALGVALAAASISVLLAPRATGAHAAALRDWMSRRAAWLAFAISLATATAGVVHGSVVPSGADASGYLSQAALWRRGDLVSREPAVLEAPWPNAAWTFSPLGYRPGRTPGDLVPTYPPGLPLHFALAGAVAGEWGQRAVVPLLGALATWCLFVLGRRLAGPVSGVAAAALLATSPPWLNQLVQPMSDVPVTAWWLACLAVASHASPPTPSRAALAGLAAGIAWLVRPNLVLLLPLPLLLVLRRHDGARGSTGLARLATFAAGVAPAIALVAALNWALYGAPWISGYGSAGELFSLSFVAGNVRLYAGWLLEVHWPLLMASGIGIGALAAWRPPADVARLWPALGLLACATAASYLIYAPFESWVYLRFLLLVIAVLALVAGVAFAALASISQPWAPVAAVLALAALAGTSWDHARQLGVFSVAARERRYELAARWLQRHAPAGAQALAAQHSGSLRATTGRTVIRWDLLEPGRGWLDAAWTGAYRRAGDEPSPAWLVLDDDEEPAFRRRFASVSELGRLDWPPAAVTPPPASVRVYRLEDRDRYRAGETVGTERIAADPEP